MNPEEMELATKVLVVVRPHQKFPVFEKEIMKRVHNQRPVCLNPVFDKAEECSECSSDIVNDVLRHQCLRGDVLHHPQFVLVCEHLQIYAKEKLRQRLCIETRRPIDAGVSPNGKGVPLVCGFP